MTRLRAKAWLVLAALTACAPIGSRHTSGSVLIFSGLSGEPDSLNPMLSNEADVLNFSHLYMSYLIENDDRGEPIGEVAREVPSRRTAASRATCAR